MHFEQCTKCGKTYDLDNDIVGWPIPYCWSCGREESIVLYQDPDDDSDEAGESAEN